MLQKAVLGEKGAQCANGAHANPSLDILILKLCWVDYFTLSEHFIFEVAELSVRHPTLENVGQSAHTGLAKSIYSKRFWGKTFLEQKVNYDKKHRKVSSFIVIASVFIVLRHKDLPADSTQAMICSYECTFFRNCVEDVLFNVCPTCDGGLCPRPIRPIEERRAKLSTSHQPPSTTRVRSNYSEQEMSDFSYRYQHIVPEKR